MQGQCHRSDNRHGAAAILVALGYNELPHLTMIFVAAKECDRPAALVRELKNLTAARVM